ncbi:MAG: outer membrane lipoprotein-sorting protein, partial [Thermodesulfobacteriota bacterium]|nr:outer membrane lipoprotein-sorting protein [Thermodesulfobacteriota bacterium]
MKSVRLIGIVLLVLFLFSSKSGICLDDCFDYTYPRQDLFKDKDGLELVKEFKKVKEGLSLKKRWPGIDLQLTPDEEKKRFGTTGLEQAQKSYLIYHFDGTQMRMMVYMKILRKMGERKIMGWRAEKNPTMPKEYLDPAFPEDKKKGIDFYWLVHWVDPPDIRGTGYLAYSYNDKKRDQDTWLWFPSLRKTRRLTPAMGADSCGGSYKTMSEVVLRRITDEVHQIVGETTVQAGILPMDIFDSLYIVEKLGPLSREYNTFIKKIAQPRKCWVVRSESVRGGYCDYYHTRVWMIDKEWGYAPVIEEMYSDSGKLFATHFHPWRRASSYDEKVAYG